MPKFLCLAIIFSIFIPRLINAASTPAIFVFGDSTSDVGTNTYIDECTAKSNIKPYGIDYFNSTPTGRWSNGMNTVDHLSALMVDFLDRSPDPYVEQVKNNRVDRFKTGVSFASGGSGLLSQTSAQAGVVSMMNQTEQFIEVRDHLYKTWGQYVYRAKISKSIFLISMGSNDILQNYDVEQNQHYLRHIDFIHQLMEAYRIFIQKLYDAGARKFAVISVIAMGCCPGQRRKMPDGSCSELQNNLSLDFHIELETLLVGFKYKYPDTFHYALGNTYQMMMDAIDGASHHDLKVMDKACCGTFTHDEDIGCGATGECCENRNEYAFWDGYHPTDAACNSTARTLYYGNGDALPNYVAPITFEQLIKEY